MTQQEQSAAESREAEQRIGDMEQSTFDIAFQHDHKRYAGWGMPSDKSPRPKSFHVVLNDVFFGNLSHHNGQWECDAQREHELVQATGEQIALQYTGAFSS